MKTAFSTSVDNQPNEVLAGTPVGDAAAAPRIRPHTHPHDPSTHQWLPYLLGCAWFALLMGAPYAPLGGNAFNIPFGASSLSKTHVWAALGLLTGTWLVSHPTVRRTMRRFPRLAPISAAVGAVLGATAVLAAWANTALLLNLPEGTLEWSACALAERLGPLAPCGEALRCILGHITPLVCISALACGGFLHHASSHQACNKGSVSSHPPAMANRAAHATAPATSAGYNHTQATRTPVSAVPAVCAAIAFALGCLQPLAWELLLPHSAFPQPNAAVSAISPERLWQQDLWTTLPGMAAPTLAMAAFAGLAIPLGRQKNLSSTPLFAGLCAGALAFRLASRVDPELFETSQSLATAALVAYALCFVVYASLALLASVSATTARAAAKHDVARKPGTPSTPNTASVPGIPSAASTSASPAVLAPTALKSVLSDQGRAFLASKQLTDREVLVVCTQIAGLTTQQAGAALGIGASTVREYRRRCRIKLGITGEESLADALPAGSIATSVKTSPADPSDTVVSPATPASSPSARRIRPLAIAVACILAACGATVLLPVPGAVRSWSDVWTTTFGMGVGLVAAQVVVAAHAAVTCARHTTTPSPGRPRPSRALAAIALTAGLAAGIAGIAAHRMTAEPVAAFNVAHNVLVLGSTALFTACFALGARWCALFLQGIRATLREGAAPHTAHGLSQLAAYALFGWLWAEAWRAQRYVSLLVPLACGALLLLAIEIYRAASMQRCGRNPLSPAAQRSPWHAPAIALAAGLAGGTLLTDVYGSLLLDAGSEAPAVTAVAYCVVGLLCALVVAARYAVVLRASTPGHEPGARTRAEATLLGRGLSPEQIPAALLLAEGQSVREIARRLGCSQAQARTSRDQIYTLLGITSRAQLVDILKSQVDDVDTVC